MISSDALLSIDLFILIVSGVFAFFSLIVGFYAVPWTRCSENDSAAKEYNKLWTVRLSLQLAATAWLLCPFIQLYQSWSSYISPIHDDSPQEKLCHAYVVLRVGCFEPFFLTLSLLTFKQLLEVTESCLMMFNRSSRESSENQRRKQPRSSRILSRALVMSIVACIIQAIAPLVPEFFGLLGRTESRHVHLLCPAISVDIYFSHHCFLVPLPCLENYDPNGSSVSVLLFSSLLFRGLMVIWNPGHVLHEFCKVMDFISMLLFILTLSLILVIRPIREARSADKTARSMTTDLFADRRYA